MFIRQACFVGVDPPLVRNLHSHTGCSYGNCALLARIYIGKLRFVKLRIRVLNYNVTGCARLIGIHLGDHRVDDIHPMTSGGSTPTKQACRINMDTQ